MGKSKTTQTESNQMPAFQQQYLQNTLLPFATNISQQEFDPYTGQMTAAVPETTQMAGQYYQAAGDISSMTPADYAAMTQANMSPYQDQVIDAALARSARERDIARTGEMADITRAGAFGNERRGVFEAERQAAYEIGRDQMVADLMQQGYSQAQAQTMAQIGQSQSAAQQAAAGYTQLGGLEQATEQARLDALMSEFMREQNLPYQQLGALTSAASGVPAGYGTTTTQSSRKPGVFDYLSAIATAGSSDRRLKKNIKHISTFDGIKLYSWEWNEIADEIGVSDGPTQGVIAQELQETYPDLVTEDDSGYLRVNYAGLALKIKEAA